MVFKYWMGDLWVGIIMNNYSNINALVHMNGGIPIFLPMKTDWWFMARNPSCWREHLNNRGLTYGIRGRSINFPSGIDNIYWQLYIDKLIVHYLVTFYHIYYTIYYIYIFSIEESTGIEGPAPVHWDPLGSTDYIWLPHSIPNGLPQ